MLLEADSLASLEGGQHDLPGKWPTRPDWHPGHRSARMSTNRNIRRRGFGYTDQYSLRDRRWPYVNRSYDAQMKKYRRALLRHGQVLPGEGI